MKPPPICKAFVICERILSDSVTKQVSVINVMESIALSTIPALLPRIHLFAMLADGLGSCAIDVKVIRSTDGVTVFSDHVGLITFPSTEVFRYVTVAVNGVPIDEPSRYDFLILADGQEIARQPLEVQ